MEESIDKIISHPEDGWMLRTRTFAMNRYLSMLLRGF
jgi:hypothetical protein